MALGFLAAGLVTLAWTVSSGLDARALDRDGVKATAQVTDFRTVDHVTGKTHRTSHELRYTFEVPGSDTVYEPEDDILGIDQGEVWVELPEKTWEASRDSGTIAITYLEDDPSVNWPHAAKRGVAHVVTFALVGAALLGLGIPLALAALRRR